ncbi:hypothetical protein AD998_06000 [bacterium 336/3]|nr:hypothetical protein AD998_06000 [bacterium 336/3]
MKKILLLLVVVFTTINSQAQNITVPDPNTPNTLFLKFGQSPTLNGEHSFTECQVWKADRSNLEWQDLYLFTFDVSLYTLNKEYFGYTELAPYNSVAITNAQLRDILSPKDFYARWPYIDSFTKIYIIDLDSPNPRQTSKYKIIEVKLYYWSKNR